MFELPDCIISEVKNTLYANQGEKLFAVFDFDGTCIDGDIQDIVFEYMIENSLIRNPHLFQTECVPPNHFAIFAYFKKLISEKRFEEGYLFQAKTLAGYTTREIQTIIHKALQAQVAKGTPLKTQGETIYLMNELHKIGVEIFIISGTPHIIVEEMIKIYSLPAHPIGIKIQITDNILTDNVEKPHSMFQGKVECIKTFIDPSKRPILAIGDSMNDLPMLEYSKIKVVRKTSGDLTTLANEKKWYLI